jgi:hypothetical protein
VDYSWVIPPDTQDDIDVEAVSLQDGSKEILCDQAEMNLVNSIASVRSHKNRIGYSLPLYQDWMTGAILRESSTAEALWCMEKNL